MIWSICYRLLDTCIVQCMFRLPKTCKISKQHYFWLLYGPFCSFNMWPASIYVNITIS